MFAGTLAARRGARTLVIARGFGGLQLGSGTVDVWGYDGAGRLASNPQAALPSSRPSRSARRRQPEPPHPLTLAGTPALYAALDLLKGLCEAAGYSLAGEIGKNHFLVTALGAVRPTCLAPESFVAGDVRRADEMTLARIPGFRDFYAGLAAANLADSGYPARTVTLDLPHSPARRDAFATDLARLFDDANYRAEVAKHWRGALKGVTRLGLPAILGLGSAAAARRDISDRLGLDVFEIPILPPSVPGMRLFDILRSALHEAGGRMIIGPGISGWVDEGRAVGVIAETAGGRRRYSARCVILATGGFRHGGLDAPGRGQIRESVFDLPVMSQADWFAPLYWDAHPFARFGVRVNNAMQPVNARGEVIRENVHAVGGLLAGADRNSEGSREGIDLATAWKAVEAAAGTPES
jgi:glycerol-3-phosphate dehydrogenase subunit B